MLRFIFGKKVALGTVTITILVMSVLFFVGSSALAQSGVEKSKTAYNETQRRDAESITARAGDIIAYTLTYRNQSGSSEIMVIEDDLTDVLYLSEITDMGGGRMSGNTIRFENISVPSNVQIERIFKVRVKQVPSDTKDNMMSNFYGNGIDIRVETQDSTTTKDGQAVTPPKQAPETGTSENVAIILAALVTSGVFIVQRRKKAFAG